MSRDYRTTDREIHVSVTVPSSHPGRREARPADRTADERGDINALLAIYTADAVIFPDQSEALSGRDNLQRYWTFRPGSRVTHHQLTSHSLVLEGGYAHDWGTFEVSDETGRKPWGPNLGKYVVVWRRGTDGTWRLQSEMWNRRPSLRP